MNVMVEALFGNVSFVSVGCDISSPKSIALHGVSSVERQQMVRFLLHCWSDRPWTPLHA